MIAYAKPKNSIYFFIKTMQKTFNFDFALHTTLSPRPLDQVVSFLQELDELTDFYRPSIEGPGILESYLQQIIDQGPNGELAFQNLQNFVAKTEAADYSMKSDGASTLMQLSISAALQFGVHALLAQSTEDAYEYLLDARFLRGYIQGITYVGNDGLVRRELAKVSGAGRHRENNQIKNDALAWYKQHHQEFRSVAAAARAATDIVPMEPETLTNWFRTFKNSEGLQ